MEDDDDDDDDKEDALGRTGADGRAPAPAADADAALAVAEAAAAAATPLAGWSALDAAAAALVDMPAHAQRNICSTHTPTSRTHAHVSDAQ